jgi:glutaredoxin-like YruB-family protein
MAMIQVNSNKELNIQLSSKQRNFLLLYKSGSENSECAFESIRKATENNSALDIFYADVNVVKDIHTAYQINSVPTLLEFNQSELKGIVKGCHAENYYKTVFEQNAFRASATDGKPQKNVTVYSTPTCPHCTTLKNYLTKNNIPYRDIDVSKDSKSAEDMVRKSGQQGVPQADINGQIVVGFDKMKIDKLLDIRVQ